MTPETFKALKPGDTVRHKSGGHPYFVLANYGDRVTAVQNADLTNPSEWDVVTPVSPADRLAPAESGVKRIDCPNCNGVGDIDDGDHSCMKCGGSGSVDAPAESGTVAEGDRETHDLRDALDRLGYDKVFGAISHAVTASRYGDKTAIAVSVEALIYALTGVRDEDARYLTAIRAENVSTRLASPTPMREVVSAPDAFEMGFSFGMSMRGQTLEDSRAVGRTLFSADFSVLHDRIREIIERDGFNSFQSADLGIFACKQILQEALTTPPVKEPLTTEAADGALRGALQAIVAKDAGHERDLGLLRQTHETGYKAGIRWCAGLARTALADSRGEDIRAQAIEVSIGEGLGAEVAEEEGLARLGAYASGCAVGRSNAITECAQVAEDWAYRWGVGEEHPTTAAGLHIAKEIRALSPAAVGGER